MSDEVKIWSRGYRMRAPRDLWLNFQRNLWEARVSFGYMAPHEWDVRDAARVFAHQVNEKPLYDGRRWPGRAHFGVAVRAGEAWEHVSVLFMGGAYVDWPDKLYEEAKYIPMMVDGFGPVIVTPT